TLDEALAGYSREADYTRKSQAHQEAVRQWEANKEQQLKADRDAMGAEREQYKAVLEIWRQQYQAITGNPQEWDQLRRDNPADCSARMLERKQHLDQLNAIVAEQQRVQTEDQTRRDNELKTRFSTEREKLLQAIPEWKDQNVYLADSGKIIEYTNARGF